MVHCFDVVGSVHILAIYGYSMHACYSWQLLCSKTSSLQVARLKE